MLLNNFFFYQVMKLYGEKAVEMANSVQCQTMFFTAYIFFKNWMRWYTVDLSNEHRNCLNDACY